MIVRRALLAAFVDMDQDIEAGVLVAVDRADTGLRVRAAFGSDEIGVRQQPFQLGANRVVPVGAVIRLQRVARVGTKLVEAVGHEFLLRVPVFI